MKTMLPILLGVSLALSHAKASAQPAAHPIKIDIESQILRDALNEWAQQTGFQLVSASSEVTGQFVVSRVKGALSAQEALERLLEGTPLTYEWLSERIVAIRVSSAPAASPTGWQTIASDSSLPQVRLAYLADDARPEEQRAQESTSAADHPQPLKEVEEVEEVVVTGSHIRGAASAGPVLAITAFDIAQTGYATVQDWLEALPQNFGRQFNEENGGQGNFNRGTGIDLRGLGAGSTLVLVNGRRQPQSGLEGSFVDVSSIPTSAIERVEILTDGASAIYGSDAIGGVVNFILRKDFSGAESSARYGAASGIEEAQFSQLFGITWSSGHAMLDYQYYERSDLAYADRHFSASADHRRSGGDDHRSFNSNPGNILNGAVPSHAIPAGQDGASLNPADLAPGVANLQEPGLGATLLPERQMHSGFVSASQQVGGSMEMFLEGRYSTRDIAFSLPAFGMSVPVTAANPFFVSPNGLPVVIVGYSFYDDFGTDLGQGDTTTYSATVGANVQLGAKWQASVYLSSGKEELDFALESRDIPALLSALADPDPATAFNPFGDGSHTNPATLAAISTLQIERGESGVLDGNIIVDGPLLSLPAGDIKVAFGGSYRNEDLDRGVTQPLSFDRIVKAGFVEMVAPVFGGSNARTGLHQLELSAAARYEDYDDFGTTSNPKFSIRYKPWDSLRLRGSWGTSFRAPRLVDLDEVSRPANGAVLTTLRDPQSPSGFSLALLRLGGNSQLAEETAATWTAGLDLQLTDSMAASVTYYDIDYEDRIVRPGPALISDVFSQEAQWSSIINRNPARSEIDAVCNSPVFSGSVAACLASTPAAIVDFRQRNLSRTHVRGLDLAIEQSIATGFGDIALKVLGSYLFDYEVAAAETATAIEVKDTINNPIALRLRATASWNYRGLGISLSLNHSGSYRDPPSRKIEAWNTLDVRASYEPSSSESWLGGIEVALSAANVLDEDPPFANNIVGYDPASATPLGRFVALQVSKSW